MSGIKIHKHTQGNAYLDGINKLGQHEGVDLPDIKFIFDEFKAMGMIGKTELPTNGVEKLTGKMKLNSVYPETNKRIANPFEHHQLQVRSNVDVFETGGLVRQVPLVTTMTVAFKNFPMGKVEQHKNVDYDYDYVAYYIKQVYDGEDVFELDILANILKVGGKDIMEDYRYNIGG